MRVVIAGSSGFLGTALRRHLVDHGHEVVRLVRREARDGESRWDPYAVPEGAPMGVPADLDQSVVDSADAVVNLAGSSMFGNPHSSSWATELSRSRVATTRVLAEAVVRSHRSGAGTPAYLAGNGISYYGDRGEEYLEEDAGTLGDAFLTRVTRAWQEAAEPAAEAGARTCILRTSPVLDRRSLPLKVMWPAWKAGLGARVGDGRQYFPMISLRDWVGAVTHVLTTPEVAGPVNLCCPSTPTNGEFTDALGAALGRRQRLAVPAAVVARVAGRLGPEVVSSRRTVPAALENSGYAFADRDVRDVLATGLVRR